MPRFRLIASVVCLLSAAQFGNSQPRPRIIRNPDSGALVRIPGSTHPNLTASTAVGRAPATMPMERMLLHLKSSPEQEAALAQLLVDQQDPGSPRFHAWLSPDEFGQQFGVAQEDIDAITNWLRGQGFQVTEVSFGRRSIEFSGTVRQVELTFHTQINRYTWQGEAHIANATEISLPEALTSVVGGIASLHNFAARPMYHHTITPLTTFSGGTHGLSPYDFATIYNLTPLWTAGYDGTGQSIAIVGQSNIKMADATGFRTYFNLPVNNPTIIVNGADPGYVSGDETESDLDVQWAGAVAKNASIKFVTSKSTNTSDGVTLSAQYIVNNKVAPVISLSYGLCEAQMGSSVQFYSSLWQQAAVQGQAVFVSAGDSGSAGCDASNSTKGASQGFGVNGLASTPYNVAVGGTQFNDTSSPATYWNAANDANKASAKSYIPEVVWNESHYAAGSSSNNLYAAGGGPSIKWPRPSWQTAPGMPSGTMRLTPDVSLTAAGHDGYVVEQNGSLYLIGGTSASTPALAGIMGIVNQYTHTTNGNPNAKFYALATQVPSVYHDIVTGTNAVPCAGGSVGCSSAAPASNVGTMTGYAAATGYDLATGLGSVDANALVTNWGGVVPAPSVTSLSPNPMAGSAAAQTLTVNGSGFVAGGSLKVTVGTTNYTGSQVTFVSSSQLTVNVTVGASSQTLGVVVMNPSGVSSNSSSLTVTGAAGAPAITTLSPNPMTGSTAAQTLTINGTGFVSGSALKVVVGASSFTGAAVNFVSVTQLKVNVTVGTSAQTLPVVVTNPNGVASNSASLSVTAPAVAPTITSLSPNPMPGSTSAQTLTIKGTGFVSGGGLKVTVGTTNYTGSQVTFASSSQVTASVTVGIVAVTLPVVVTNPSGLASNSSSLTVKAPLSPTISSLSPNPMTASATAQALTVNGTGFVSGCKLVNGSVTIASTSFTSFSATQIKVSVIASSAGNYVFQVVNPDGTSSGTVTLQAVLPPPSITTLTPNPMTSGTATQTLTINGANFVSGSTLKVTVGTQSFTGTQVTFVSATQLRVSLKVTAAGTLPVQVTNSSTSASNTVSLTVK